MSLQKNTCQPLNFLKQILWEDAYEVTLKTMSTKEKSIPKFTKEIPDFQQIVTHSHVMDVKRKEKTHHTSTPSCHYTR